MKQLVNTLFISLLLFSVHGLAGTLTVTADRSTLSADETLQIKVRFDEQVFLGSLDTTPLNKDFELLSSGRQQKYSSVNGKSTSFTDWNITLQPRKTGTLTIPALEFDGAKSQPLIISVSPAKQATSGQQGEPVFVETDISDRSVYVQQQLILTYRLYMAVRLQNVGMSDLNLPDVEMFKLDENHFQKTIGGTAYQVIEVSFALFPQNSGELVIPASQFEGYIPVSRNDPFFGSRLGNGKRFRLSADSYNIEVKAKPDQLTGHWLPAQNVQLHESWSGDFTQWRVGEPITRTITVTGQGVTSSQLPEINVSETDHYRVYPDQPELGEQPQAGGMIAQRNESIAFVPSKAGPVTLPAVEVQWWDTSSNSLRTTSLPGQTVKVLASTTQAYSPQVSVPNSGLSATENSTVEPVTGSIWLTVSMALNALLLLLVFRLMTRKPTSAKGPAQTTQSSSAQRQEKALFNAIKESAKANNPQQFQHHIIRWAQYRWPQASLKTLAEVADFLGDETLQYQINTLSDNLYGGQQQSVDLMAIASIIKKLRANGFTRLNSDTTGLKPLYPAG